MWFMLILYSTLTLAAKGEMRLCSTPVYSVCRPNPQNAVIPQNAEELLRICPSLVNDLECLHSYDLACRGRSEFPGLSPPLYYSRIKSVLDDACDQRSSVHRALGRSLPCIKLRVSRIELTCSLTRDTISTAYENYLSRSFSRKIKKAQAKKECLNLMADVACIMEDIEKKCGFTAYSTSHDLVMRLQVFPHKCGLDIFLELKDVIEELNLESNTKEELRKFFVVEIE